MNNAKQYNDKKQRLYNLIAADWKAVRDVTALTQRIKTAAGILEYWGYTELAADWLARLENAPKKMNKDSINSVLWSASLELQEKGII